MFLLDTEHIIVYQSKTGPDFARLLARMAKHPASVFYLSIVSFHEQALGAKLYVNRATNPRPCFTVTPCSSNS
jgi:tRNA(fMet)-specific endonuclease VapC